MLSIVMNYFLPERLSSFSLPSQREISTEDEEFVLRIMKLDPRDRPTAQQLFEDESSIRI